MGVDFGPRLRPPNADNPRGYFEHNDVVNLHDRLLLALDRSWDEFVALVAGARCVICLESSAAHLAAAFRVPTVAIFTGTNEHRLWGPDNAHARVISAPTACAPCHRTGCDAMACVRHVTVAMVLDRLDELPPPSRS